MKKKRFIFVFAVMLLTVVLGNGAFVTRARAATVTNVLKAPKAKAGQWVVASKGYRYRYQATRKYAKNAWLNIDGKIYYFKSNGYLQTGWKTYRNKRYYLNSDGTLAIGWKKVGKNKYYLSSANGAALTGKKKIGSAYYYFSSTGKMQTGWKKIGKYYYYFDKQNGSMAVNTKVGKYYVDQNGRRTTTPVGQTTLEKTGKVDIFIGDSRTEGMCSAVHGKNCTKCIAKMGEGYSWLVSTAIPKLKKKLKSKPDATVVFNLGINDVAGYAKYISKYRNLIKKYPQAKFYFMSLNPIDSKYDKAGYYGGSAKMKSWIKKFNKNLKKAFPNQYIDCYTYLNKKGFSTRDGLHYTASTYKKIYQYILEQV